MDKIFQLLEYLNIDTVFVFGNCSGELQPLGLSVNKPVKDLLPAKFYEWYAAEIFGSYRDAESCSTLEPIKFFMSQMKPLGAQ